MEKPKRINYFVPGGIYKSMKGKQYKCESVDVENEMATFVPMKPEPGKENLKFSLNVCQLARFKRAN